MAKDKFDKATLERMYFEEKLSVPAIAEKFGTYPNKIRRALKGYGFDLRSNAEAQALALSVGRASHPTEGLERSDEEKLKIGLKQRENYANLSEEEKDALAERSRELWNEKSEKEIREMRSKAIKAIQKASREGSVLEHVLKDSIEGAGYTVLMHQEKVLLRERLQLDLYIPALRTVIEVDGKNHEEAIWGSKTFSRTKRADNVKSGLVLQSNLVMIRVTNKSKGNTYNKQVADTVLAKLAEIKENFPKREDRYIIIDVE